MKIAFARVIIAMAAIPGFCYCQTATMWTNNGGTHPQAHRHLSAEEITTARIAHMLSSQAPLTKMTIPLLNRMGDGAAAEILKIMSARAPLSPVEQRNALDMVHKAFEKTAAITQAPNKTPTASLNLLQQLAGLTTNAAFRFQVADTQQFVLDATSAQ